VKTRAKRFCMIGPPRAIGAAEVRSGNGSVNKSARRRPKWFFPHVGRGRQDSRYFQPGRPSFHAASKGAAALGIRRNFTF
jgi:hypothetical protein